MKRIIEIVLALSVLLVPSTRLAAAETLLVQTGTDDLVACSGTGMSMGLYCDSVGCASVDEGFLAKGACPADSFTMKESEEKEFDEASWGRTRLAELASEKDPDETIILLAALPYNPSDFPSLATAKDQETRDLMIEERKNALAPVQELAEFLVEDMGGIVHQRTWLVPGLIIEIPASASDVLLDEVIFVDLSPGDGDVEIPGVANEGWGGLDITDGTLSEDLYQLEYRGEYGGRTSSPSDNIKIGIAEVNDPDTTYPEYLNCDHVGWHDWYMQSNPPTRLKKAEICDATSCYGSACDNTHSTHSTWVSWAAAGSIEQKQDRDEDGPGPDVGYESGVHTDEQRRRSGVASEADLYFYYPTGSCGKTTALQQAIEDGVDVFNMSFWSDSYMCDLTHDSCGLNAELENAANEGVILVGISGNRKAKAENGYCSVSWPATRSSVLSVNGLGSKFEGTPYQDLERVTWTSTGDVSIQVSGGATRSIPLVDIVAPAAINWYFTTGTDNYANDSVWGTSFAAPILSGIAGLTREWMDDIGWSTAAANPRLLLTNLMVMGDGYAGVLGSPSGEYRWTVSEWSGYGRIRAHLPVASSIGRGAGWSTGYNWLSTGGVRYHPLPGNPQSTNIEGIKAAVAWYDSDFQGVGDLKVQIVDLCPSGGGEEVIRTASSSQTMRKRIQVWENENIHDRCLYLRIEALNASGEMYYYSMYTYSNSQVYH